MISLVLVLLAFTPTILSFPPAWLNRGGQGFAAAGFAIYLLWRDRNKLGDFSPAIPEVSLVVACLSLLWLAAYVLNVQVVHQAALPLVVLAWLLAVGGARPAMVALPIVAVFFLAVPVWGLLTGVLQAMTILVNGLLLKGAGIKAVISGEYIEISAGVFWVAQGCAGLNYFETSLLISAIYALIFLRQWRYRMVAIGIAVALALVSNWLRVFGLIVIGHVTNMKSSLIDEHELYGWVIFAVAMIFFFAITGRIEKLDRRLPDATGAGHSVHRAAVELNSSDQSFSVAGTRLGTARVSHIAPSRMALPTFAAVLGPVLFFALGGQSASGAAPATAPGVTSNYAVGSQPELVSTSDGLHALGPANAPGGEVLTEPTDRTDSTAVDSTSRVKRGPPEWRPVYNGADHHRISQYTFAANIVRVDRLIYVEQGQGKELVSGLNVISGQQYILSKQTVGPLDATGRMINTTVVRTPDGARLVWHWFSVAGSVTHSATRAKLLELVAFVRSESPPAELITVSTLCGPDNCTAAGSTLYKFVLGPLPY